MNIIRWNICSAQIRNDNTFQTLAYSELFFKKWNEIQVIKNKISGIVNSLFDMSDVNQSLMCIMCSLYVAVAVAVV